MSNMSYCRFQNTLSDLRDCAEHIDDALGKDEHRARLHLIDHCVDILDAIGIEVDVADVDAGKRGLNTEELT